MISIPTYLRNTEAVVSAFGYWPSFHDAPVHDFRYNKEGNGEVELTLHGSEMTKEVDEQGYFKLIKHHLVKFKFRQISEANLDRFMEFENILFELGLSTLEEFEAVGKFKVSLDSAMGGDLCGSFTAGAGEVMEVLTCDAKGNKTELGTTLPPRNLGKPEGTPPPD